ncbi:MAG: carbohydrate ABC transporter permease [Lachnospiraceae bacterium]
MKKTSESASAEKQKKKRIHAYQRRQNRLGYLFMAPWILGFLVFTLFPFAATIYLSFTNVVSTIKGWEITFVGLDNYVTAFFKNVEFVPALLDFLLMIIPYTFVVVIVSFIIAYLLNKLTKFRGMFRTIYFLPVIIMSGPVMSQILDVSVSEHMEEVSRYDGLFIMNMIESYSRPFANLLGSVLDELSVILWFTGIPIVLFINGLQKINPSLYEAARIDSANNWQILWKIVIPLIKPIALVCTIFTIAQLGTYDTNPVYGLIKTATGNMSGGLGFAATYAWIYSFVVLLIIGLAFLLFKEKKEKRGGVR